MFGIGKGKEAKKVIVKEAKRGENEIQFDFEEDDKLPFDDDDGLAEEEFEEESVRRTSPSRSIMLLGLLLLLALGGGGYYYLNSTPVPPVQPPAPVKTKVKVQLESPVATTAPAPVAVKPVSPAPVVTTPAKIAPTPAVTAPVAPVPPPAAVVVTPVEKSAVAPPAAVPVTRLPYTLTAGTFLNQKHQRAVEKKIRRLGYTPKVETTYSMVPMTRLLLGVYAPAVAAARRQELATQVPELFTQKQGDKVALYAGSYQSLDAARSSADQLFLRGIHVDEETVSLRMPMKKISYGSFATRAAAEKAVKRAATAGLMVQVIKR